MTFPTPSAPTPFQEQDPLIPVNENTKARDWRLDFGVRALQSPQVTGAPRVLPCFLRPALAGSGRSIAKSAMVGDDSRPRKALQGLKSICNSKVMATRR